MFSTLLIANRGEIACRVMRTARRLGMHTIAVYSEADAAALHVRTADEAVCIGPAPARESYLHAGRILEAARATGAQAIHPGYGFLSESAHFAQACADAGVVFVGPPPDAIRAMGSKSAAKALMEAAGVPLTPGYHGDNQDAAFLATQAGRIGFPVLIKASAGGGGKGMRRVDRAEDFAAALAACKREALAAFGSDQVLLEKYILQPRHIEVQVFADTQGNVVHLFERDCSVQRRHQKVLEEAPAPGMTPERRAAMGHAAVQVARAVGYVGAGTVEFIAPRAGGTGAGDGFYFMEMNTRLQVEHPVTEMITGLDLVEWQLRVAAGEPLPAPQQQLAIRGHAMEARLYAEDADHGFVPATGRLAYFEEPEASPHVRLDAGVAQGDEITPHYDPMIAKLIAWGPDRETARTRLRDALARTRIAGVINNVGFLGRLVESPSFASALLDTDLIERDAAHLAPRAEAPGRDTWAIAALAQLSQERAADHHGGRAATAWGSRDAWRANQPGIRKLYLTWHGHEGREARVVQAQALRDGGWELALEDATLHAKVTYRDGGAAGGRLQVQLDGRALDATAVLLAGHWHVFVGAQQDRFECRDRPAGSEGDADDAHPGTVLAPMPGKVIALLAAPGTAVSRDAPLLIVEAMKMEHTVRATRGGTLQAFRVAVGDQVAMGDQLADFAVQEPGPAEK